MPAKPEPPAECERCAEPSTRTIRRHDYSHRLCEACARRFLAEVQARRTHGAVQSQPILWANVRLYRDADGNDVCRLETSGGTGFEQTVAVIDLRDHRDPYERDRPKTRRVRDAPPHAHKPPDPDFCDCGHPITSHWSREGCSECSCSNDFGAPRGEPAKPRAKKGR